MFEKVLVANRGEIAEAAAFRCSTQPNERGESLLFLVGGSSAK